MPYCGIKGEALYRSCVAKIRKYLRRDKPVIFKLSHDVTKMERFCNTKDQTPELCRSFVVYKFTCPGCSDSYVGKTERTLFERTQEHGWSDKNSAIFKHISECDKVHFLQSLLSFDLPPLSCEEIRLKSINLVRENTVIIDSHCNWNILLFKEALKIKGLSPTLNNGHKASKDLQLFTL